MKRRASLFAVCLLIVSAVVVSHQFRRMPAVAPIDTSMLTADAICWIGVSSSDASKADSCQGYEGTVAQVNRYEVVLHDAVYQEIAGDDTEIRRDVGTVHIPLEEIVAIKSQGRVEPESGDSFERIGVHFR